jgi:hypothetical protein
MKTESLSLDVDQSVQIKAGIDKVFDRLIYRLTEGNETEEGNAMPMKMERRPGGRWYRDLGDDAGHLWGFVQSIRPPALLELYGQMFMSAPVSSHIIIRLKEIDGGTELSFRYRALGLIEAYMDSGVDSGWKHYVNAVKKDLE